MAVRKRATGKRSRGTTPKKNKAKVIIQSMAGRGAQRSKLVQRRVEAAGISTRTYRSARKEMKALAIRKPVKGGKRGTGRWYVKAKRYSKK